MYMWVLERVRKEGNSPNPVFGDFPSHAIFLFSDSWCAWIRKNVETILFTSSLIATQNMLLIKKIIKQELISRISIARVLFIEVPQLGIPFWNASSHLNGELFETPEWKNICLTYFKWLCLNENLPDFLALSGQGKHVQNILLYQGFSCIKSVCAQQRDFSLPLEEAHQDLYFLHVLCKWGLIKLSLNGAFVF